MSKYNKVGVLGGMGPLATVIFYNKVIELSNAPKDQDNIDMVILNDSKIPDRTEYILNKSDKSPLEPLLKDVKYLEKCDTDLIVMTCNTAHYFYDELEKSTDVKMLNMLKLVTDECSNRGFKKVVLLATKGTIKAGVYQKYSNDNLEIVIPNEEILDKLHSFIYDYVKQNKDVPKEEFLDVLNYFYNMNIDGIILGCTELSVINDKLKLNDSRIVDSTTTLAEEVVKLCL